MDFILFGKSQDRQHPKIVQLLKNKPKAASDSNEALSRQRANMVVPELLMTFAHKVVTHKLDGIVYWAQQNGRKLPDNFTPTEGTELTAHFLDQMKETDKMFLNKLCFYLAKEKVDYKGIDSFLNLYILRKWPELRILLMPGEESATNHFKIRRGSGSQHRTQPGERTVPNPIYASIFQSNQKLEQSSSKDAFSMSPAVKVGSSPKNQHLSQDRVGEESRTWAEPTLQAKHSGFRGLSEWPQIKSLKRYKLK